MAETAKTPQQPAITEKNIVDNVSNRVSAMMNAGEIKLPENYSVENALKSAYLQLVDQLNKDNKPVLESCTQPSIANALLKMVVQGLSVAKNQCYFIPYGDKLTFQRSYNGSIALAKRVAGVVKIPAFVIYEGDKFEMSMDLDSGTVVVTEHQPSFENIDNKKITGAYAIMFFKDGSKKFEIMTIAEIEQAWKQGATKGGSPAHLNFRQEMAKKTVISRACKEPIATSDDSHLFFDEDEAESVQQTVHKTIQIEANKEAIGFDEVAAEPIVLEKSPSKEVVEAKGIDFPEEV